MKSDNMISKRISKIIENELSWTNGWYVKEEKYKELCNNATIKIIRLLNKQEEKQ